MRKNFYWALCVLMIFALPSISWNAVHAKKLNLTGVTEKTGTKTESPALNSVGLFAKYADEIYQTARLEQSGMDESVFKKALTGFINLKMANLLPKNSSIITVVDLSMPSREKRMWIVDLTSKQLLIHTWVAHGSGSGTAIARNFSDIDDSHQSSLGFYVTDNVYVGKHGRSLHLNGLDEGFNDLARAREIVVHAAPYVSQQTINATGRIGCSWGCPAVSPKISNKVINTIKDRTMLFINGNDDSYTSKYLNESNLSNYDFSANS
ncbi:MAG: murein L,D-transpeptidase catalytic domain family protein [Mucilaginibacter sp.]